MVYLSDDTRGRMPFRFENNYHTDVSIDVCVSALAESVVAILDLLRCKI